MRGNVHVRFGGRERRNGIRETGSPRSVPTLHLTHSPDAANVLFQVVDHRYLHKRPMLFTTNKPLSQWGRVLHDPDLAEAITDRVLERGRSIQLRGPSYRTRHLENAEKGAEKEGDLPCS